MQSNYKFHLALLGMLLPLTAAHAQTVTCSNGVFQGTYFYNVSGSLLGTSTVPYSESGKLVADGQGNVTGIAYNSQNGIQASNAFNGTYTVNSSCSGTMSLTINAFPVAVSFQVLNNGQNAVLAFSSPTEIVAGTAVRATASSSAQCSNASLAGSYGYVLSGTATGNPYTEAGQFTADGAGNVTTNSTYNRNGTVTQTTGNGAYMLSSDCTGSLTLSTQTGNHTFRIAVVPGTRAVSFLETDAGTLVNGSALPSTLSRSVLPDVVSGLGFSTTLYFTNQTDAPVAFTVYFIGDDGNPFNVPSLASTTANVSIAPRGTAILDVPNNATGLVQGYASALLPAGVSASGVIRQIVAGRVNQQAQIPFATSTSTFNTISFDDTGTLVTALSIVNPSSAPATITVTARDLNGNSVGTSTFTLAAQAKTAVLLRNLAGLSGVAGLRGSVDVSVNTGNVSVLALRFDSGGNFTNIPVTSR